MPETIQPVGIHKGGYGHVPPWQPPGEPASPPNLIGTERLCFGLGAPATGVNRAIVHLYNPVPAAPEAPLFLLTIEAMYALELIGNGGLYLWRYDGITSGARVAGKASGTRDTRLGRNDCNMQVWQDDVVLANVPGLDPTKDLLGLMLQVSADPTANKYFYSFEWTIRLAPGTGFFVGTGVNGHILNVNFFTRERRVTAQELAQLILD